MPSHARPSPYPSPSSDTVAGAAQRSNEDGGRQRARASDQQQQYPAPSTTQHQQEPRRRTLARSTRAVHPINDDAASDSASDDAQPAAKRRKLSIRGKQQTTLDRFTIATPHPTTVPPAARPPTKVTLAQPGGKLLETINGVRNELEIVADDTSKPIAAATPLASQPALAKKKEEKRTLRSQDEGPRLKSELAVYFPNYEDVIFDAPKEEDFITVDTTFYLTDDVPKSKGEQSSPPKGPKDVKSNPIRRNNGFTSPTTPSRSASSLLNGSPSLSNFELISKNLPAHPVDPLSDEHFLKSHRRAERKEKQLRNIEKERAMHEKVQLDRLLEGLQGHDWLKVLGITGVTDGEAKKFEPKRDYFIAEVQALVDKFKQWKEQEKRIKMEKEEAAAAAAREEEESEEEEGSVEPPSSDLNDSAARQLQLETALALKQSSGRKGKEKDRGGGGPSVSHGSTPSRLMMPPPPPFVPEEPITSFYAKRHLRDAALGKARHGRTVLAFGLPIPDMEEAEFELPDDYVSQDVLRANARDKRRRKRASIMDANS